MLVFLFYNILLFLGTKSAPISSVEPSPVPQVLDCKKAFPPSKFEEMNKRLYLTGDFTLKNFRFNSSCTIKIGIYNLCWADFDILASGAISSTDGSWNSEYDGSTFNTDNSSAPVKVAAPYINLKFPGGDNFTDLYFIRFSLILRPIPGYYGNKQLLSPITENGLSYIRLNELVPNISYMIDTPDQLWNIRRPYSIEQIYNGLEIPAFPNILIFNGTTSGADPMGFMTRLLLPKYAMGLNLQGFWIKLIEPSPTNLDPELCKLLVMEKTKIDVVAPVFIYFIYWNRGNYSAGEAIALSVSPPDKRTTYRVMLISQEVSPAVLEEFSLAGLVYGAEQNLPDMEVYGGWNNPKNDSNLLAKYTNATYGTYLPQQFGGKLRTIVIHNRDTSTITSLWLVNPKSPTRVAIADRWSQDFEPFYGRKGFLRNNWWDETYSSNKTELLQWSETPNKTVFSFEFTMRSGCEPTSYLAISAKTNGNTTSSRLNCTDGASMTVTGSSIQVELVGNAVVDYSIPFAKAVVSLTHLHMLVATVLLGF